MEDNHEERLQELLRLQAERTLKVANAETLDRRINDEGEAVNRESSVVSQFLEAFHAAVPVNLQNMIQNTTESFIANCAAPSQRETNSSPPHSFLLKHAGVIQSARTLDTLWAQMVEVADNISGDLAVSIPQTWL